MSAVPPPSSPPRDKPGLLNKFRAELARDELNMATASFADRGLEAEYKAHLYGASFPALRVFCAGGPIFWFLFGVLDFLTIRENLEAVSTIRWLIAGPIAIALVLALFTRSLQRYYEWIITLGMANFCFGMIAIIALLPAQGSPPYIIGMLVTFAYASCFLRIRFLLGAAVYAASTLAYCVMLLSLDKFSYVDVVSGYFCVITIATVAIVTHYAQEIRSRQIWRRNRQRALDAAYIEELLIEATAADQSKLNFISILSHELRTPLHQIIGFSEIVMQRFADGETEKSDEFLSDIRTSAHELLARIAKMLRYADATAGKIKYEFERVSSRELSETLLIQAKALAAARHVEIDDSGVEAAEMWIDHPHTSYGLGHLIENAVKASASGSTVILRGRVEADGGYTIEVEDKGVGMTSEQIKAAFEPFSQVQQVRTRSLDGIGLGLTLARKIIQDQGAALSISSARGEGTTATIRFAPPPPKPERTADAA